MALSENCFPEIVTGSLPVIYPFIVSNPGEAAQAKRRIAAVTLGHLPPPLAGAGLDENQQKLERLVDEYAQADGLDRRRRDRLAKLIVETAQKTGLAAEAGVAGTDAPDEALRRIDAWLCDLKDFAIKDGLHIYGRSPKARPIRCADKVPRPSATALIAALDGRHVKAGPAGRAGARPHATCCPPAATCSRPTRAPCRRRPPIDLGQGGGRTKCCAATCRTMATGRARWSSTSGAAPRCAPAARRSRKGLALMGCRPQWDAATGRVTGIEVLPPAALGRPRVDVTWRISGLFRDMFPTQIALIDAAANAVAARDEDDFGKPARGQDPRGRKDQRRAFSAPRPAPTAPASRIFCRAATGQRAKRLGRAYLDATSHAYGGAEGEGVSAPGAFAGRIAEADLLVHTGDDPGRDILEGSADVAFIGGFSAALAALGRNADVIVLDTTDPQRPKPRSVTEAVSARRAGARDQSALHRRARCATARAAHRNSPKRSTGWSALPKPPMPYPAR